MSASKSDCRVRPVQLLVLVLLGMLAPGGPGKPQNNGNPRSRFSSSSHTPRRGWRCARQIHCEHHSGRNLNPTPLIVNNQAGGSSTVGTTAVAQSPGNEHMLVTFISGQVAAPLAAGKGRQLTTISP